MSKLVPKYRYPFSNTKGIEAKFYPNNEDSQFYQRTIRIHANVVPWALFVTPPISQKKCGNNVFAISQKKNTGLEYDTHGTKDRASAILDRVI